jgi:uncharacterized protein
VEFQLTAILSIPMVQLVEPAVWAGSASYLSLNGKRVTQPLIAGEFHPISRTWIDGDLIELSLERPQRMEPVDDKHPDLIGVRQRTAGSADWQVTTDDGVQTFKPFYAIGSERIRLYQRVSS